MKTYQTARREQRLVETFRELLPKELSPAPLVYDEGGYVGRWIRNVHPPSTVWNRWSIGDSVGVPEPPNASFETAVIRLPHSRDSLSYALNMIAGRLVPGGQLWICGANDEGIKSTAKRMGPLFSTIQTAGVKNHCRLLSGRRTEAPARSKIDHWWTHQTLNLRHETVDWYSLPGVFSRGRLDPATALLLDHLPQLKPKSRILDFGCGTGIIAWACQRLEKTIQVSASDADSLALKSTARNLDQVRLIQSDGWRSIPREEFDLIISNPPIHKGKSEDHSVLDQLIDGARKRLSKDGQLVIVGQGRLGLKHRMKAAFEGASCTARTNRFQIWSSR
ncbi:MAG: methyltransferase [Myxococcota bacterium]|nr:methyltransferase [Myxococcota bacterium]